MTSEPAPSIEPAPLAEPVPLAESNPLIELVEIMRRLRAECAWKAEQTHESLLPYLREEAAEVEEAVHESDDAHLCEELGDLLLQVVFHAAVAEERGAFTMDDVAAGITAKLRRRNPHVFDPASLGRAPDDPPLTAAEVNAIWEQVKATER
ncbi:MazG nucleotide pyrophosphohydrolase domain-containing protein [Nocardioides daejeonensis]|uniref:MazG nucleotide pyrophosphohydrolase domain-containing protein n=1 Tax=Nocardioides daejeonensis TaxID=1046556 RepID=UPI001951853C|nr:MazG nucleotide pyrophosphohydrolase domain-containing protein [Nocardioides daejeonensis]